MIMKQRRAKRTNIQRPHIWVNFTRALLNEETQNLEIFMGITICFEEENIGFPPRTCLRQSHGYSLSLIELRYYVKCQSEEWLNGYKHFIMLFQDLWILLYSYVTSQIMKECFFKKERTLLLFLIRKGKYKEGKLYWIIETFKLILKLTKLASLNWSLFLLIGICYVFHSDLIILQLQ